MAIKRTPESLFVGTGFTIALINVDNVDVTTAGGASGLPSEPGNDIFSVQVTDTTGAVSQFSTLIQGNKIRTVKGFAFSPESPDFVVIGATIAAGVITPVTFQVQNNTDYMIKLTYYDRTWLVSDLAAYSITSTVTASVQEVLTDIANQVNADVNARVTAEVYSQGGGYFLAIYAADPTVRFKVALTVGFGTDCDVTRLPYVAGSGTYQEAQLYADLYDAYKGHYNRVIFPIQPTEYFDNVEHLDANTAPFGANITDLTSIAVVNGSHKGTVVVSGAITLPKGTVLNLTPSAGAAVDYVVADYDATNGFVYFTEPVLFTTQTILKAATKIADLYNIYSIQYDSVYVDQTEVNSFAAPLTLFIWMKENFAGQTAFESALNTYTGAFNFPAVTLGAGT